MNHIEKEILQKVFTNLLDIREQAELDKLRRDIDDVTTHLAHEYALCNQDDDREKYLIWKDIQIMLTGAKVY